MSLITIYTELLKRVKNLKETDVRKTGISLKRIRQMRFIEKMKSEEIKNRKEFIPLMYGSKRDGL